MTKRSAFMEWLGQIKRLSKAVDYAALDGVDLIFDVLPYLKQETLKKHKAVIDDACFRYHKPNPLQTIHKRIIKTDHFCVQGLNHTVDGLFNVLEALYKEIYRQWEEAIDFCYERPCLVNPAALDDYIRERITYVCKIFRKNNPLIDGTEKHFGKHWLGPDGKWHIERRKLF